MLKNLEQKKGERESFVKHSGKVIQETKKSSTNETDHTIFEQQYNIAHDLYKDRCVSISDSVFTFTVPQLLASGKGFKYMEYQSGEHFNDLPETSPEEYAYKKDVAKAILTLELSCDL